MKAAVLYGKEDVRVEEISARPVGPGEVRVEIHAALTCGTDLKVYRRGYHARMIVPPAVFGHEFAGVISEVGPGLTDWRVGDRVVAANSAPCGICRCCRASQANLCDDLLFLNGAYAESIVVPARLVEKNLLRLRPETSYLDAALVEPLACVVLGVEETQLRAGEQVLVLGAGPIGLMFVVLARHHGCRVTVAGRRATRLEMARRLGAQQVVDVGTDPAFVGTIRSQLPEAPDVVIEAVGKPEAWEAAAELVRKGGRVNFFGGCPAGTSITLDTGRLHYSSISLLASFHHTPAAIRCALELVEQGTVKAADFVDGECFLDDLPLLLKSMTGGNRAVKTHVRVRR